MSTPIIQNLIPSLKETVSKNFQAYMGGLGELSPINESLESWYDHYRESMAPELPQWHDLPSPDKDQLFDAWIASVEDFFRQRIGKSDSPASR